jgi:hypothetical protein
VHRRRDTHRLVDPNGTVWRVDVLRMHLESVTELP